VLLIAVPDFFFNSKSFDGTATYGSLTRFGVHRIQSR